MSPAPSEKITAYLTLPDSVLATFTAIIQGFESNYYDAIAGKVAKESRESMKFDSIEYGNFSDTITALDYLETERLKALPHVSEGTADDRYFDEEYR